MTDRRSNLYESLHQNHARGELARIRSAERILRTLFEFFVPGSLLDVGCGIGLWLSVAEQMGVAEVAGIEGPWIQQADVKLARSKLIVHDLEMGFDLNRKFDLVTSIEVAEHLSASAAERFISCLTLHGDLVLFSAAIPGQGGTGHLNEQYPDYWAAKFAEHGYQPLDFLRRKIWNDKSIHVWLRQNVILYASEGFLTNNNWARASAGIGGPLSIVHPEIFDAFRAASAIG